MYVKAITGEIFDTHKIMRVLFLSLAIVFVPQFIHNQIITGTIVNAILIFALFSFGFRQAFVLCFVPSFMALAGGLLPSILYPMLPFIMLSNVFLIGVSYILYNSNSVFFGYWRSVITAAFFKFIFLYTISLSLASLSTSTNFFSPFLLVFSWPQLATAILGALLASLFINKKAKNK